LTSDRSLPRRALTIGTSDSSGLAGVQSDARTFAALGLYGTSVVTAVAARNTRALAAVAEVPDEVVIAQVDAVLEDIGTDAVKVGALWSRSIAENIADRLEAWGNQRMVVAPGMAMMIEAARLEADFLRTLTSDLVPQALVLVVDVREAELLAGIQIGSADAAIEACRQLQNTGRCAVYLSASDRDMSNDVLLDGDEVIEVAKVRRSGVSTAETTEVFSAALTGFLALGFDLKAAVEEASRLRDDAVARAFAAGEGVMSLDVRSGPPATTAG